MAIACICARAQVRALALDQAKYEIQAGAPVLLGASGDNLDFLLKASSRSVLPASGITVGLNRAGDQVMLAASLNAKPGEYKVALAATGASGEQRQAAIDVVVKPRASVPSNSTRPPVILLNGWETGYVNSCPISTDSTETFGNLAQYLESDGVPTVYFFDNCAEGADQTLETLAADLATFLGTITYDNGAQVTQIDLVAHSIGGLIVRAYLAGLQTNATLVPPLNPLVRDLVLIAVPNFGSFVAANFTTIIPVGTQSAELVPGSAFLWNLNTWNQHVDDLRGVNAIAVIGNAGTYVNDLTGISLANASDGIVSTTSASLGFVAQNNTMTRIVPYCQVDPGAFTNTSLEPYNCSAPGIANVTDTNHPTGQIVRSFLAGTTDWQSIGTTPSADPYLSTDGGFFFGLLNDTAGYVSDIRSVTWGTLMLSAGGDTDTFFYNDFASGTGIFTAASQSLGSVDCGTVTAPVGYFTAARCKFGATIVSVGPLLNTAARQVAAGSTITITGDYFGPYCNGCKVTATPAGTTTTQNLSVVTWTTTSIMAKLPAGLSGMVTIGVYGTIGNDVMNVVIASPTPTVTGVENAGGFQTGIAPAAWIAIFGTSLAQSTYTWQPSDIVKGALPTELQGVSVTIDGKPAYVEYISPTQINVLAPDDTKTGAVVVQVTSNGEASNSFNAAEAELAPAFFASNGTVAAEHANYSVISAASPAAPGETILLYGTGFGPTSPVSPSGQTVSMAAALANGVQVTIGGVAVTPAFAGLVESGVYQFNVTVPAGLGSGNAAVTATVGGLTTQSGVSIPVQ